LGLAEEDKVRKAEKKVGQEGQQPESTGEGRRSTAPEEVKGKSQRREGCYAGASTHYLRHLGATVYVPNIFFYFALQRQENAQVPLSHPTTSQV
jgi:hypothetical protein